jgi:hypothetical protein
LRCVVTGAGTAYPLPPYSITIVTRAGDVLYQSRNVSSRPHTTRVFSNATAAPLAWECWSEFSTINERARQLSDPGAEAVVGGSAVASAQPVEQLRLTLDRTEYLIYVAYPLRSIYIHNPDFFFCFILN